ncbi:MAG: serine hydrolase [Jatrophihabitantaceae bacterium]
MDLDELLARTRALGAQWSISIRREDDPAAFIEDCPGKLLRTASVAKVFVLMELADRLARNAIDAEQLIDRRETHAVLDSGIWHAMHVDSLPVIDLAVLVGAVSDNWATNALIDVCGLDRIQALAAAAAPRGSMLHDYVRNDRSGDVPDTLSDGCAQDWARIMQRLYYADGLDAAVCHHVLAWLAQDADLSMVAAAFDLDPLAHDTEDLGVRLWHKTGTDLGVRADVGVIRSTSTVVSYAVVCNWPATDAHPHTRRAVHSTMRRIGDEIRSDITRGST